eukprot:Blabericola_migrator_1__270@NODE_106_length_14174_cov_318_190118_g94_i0_p5_GENE_NODE_106_length_14174_cov_318_190118_g94_i0NODE_106_length_14174_cov_318_190118_g94_i0_p5_ORF_typecomplete_len521_score87_09_NODE_106_length_14174_cov_318_190118_g94_i0801642
MSDKSRMRQGETYIVTKRPHGYLRTTRLNDASRHPIKKKQKKIPDAQMSARHLPQIQATDHHAGRALLIVVTSPLTAGVEEASEGGVLQKVSYFEQLIDKQKDNPKKRTGGAVNKRHSSTGFAGNPKTAIPVRPKSLPPGSASINFAASTNAGDGDGVASSAKTHQRFVSRVDIPPVATVDKSYESFVPSFTSEVTLRHRPPVDYKVTQRDRSSAPLVNYKLTHWDQSSVPSDDYKVTQRDRSSAPSMNYKLTHWDQSSVPPDDYDLTQWEQFPFPSQKLPRLKFIDSILSQGISCSESKASETRTEEQRPMMSPPPVSEISTHERRSMVPPLFNPKVQTQEQRPMTPPVSNPETPTSVPISKILTQQQRPKVPPKPVSKVYTQEQRPVTSKPVQETFEKVVSGPNYPHHEFGRFFFNAAEAQKAPISQQEFSTSSNEAPTENVRAKQSGQTAEHRHVPGAQEFDLHVRRSLGSRMARTGFPKMPDVNATVEDRPPRRPAEVVRVSWPQAEDFEIYVDWE